MNAGSPTLSIAVPIGWGAEASIGDGWARLSADDRQSRLEAAKELQAGLQELVERLQGSPRAPYMPDLSLSLQYRGAPNHGQ